MQAKSAPAGASSLSLSSLLPLGVELFGEIQRIIGSSQVRSLRIKLGGRTLKEVPVAPLTAVTTLLLVALAVVISSISIEVEHEPSQPKSPKNAANEARP